MKNYLGLDFDNTIVQYDRLFHQVATERSLIPVTIEENKLAIREYLRITGREEEFTLIQAEVYGKRIIEAKASVGVLEALKKLEERGVKMTIVSHKTKFPYAGPQYNLREAAINWLEENKFFSESGLNWKKNQVYFEDSKKAKIRRIEELRVSYYIDDLPEILLLLPSSIKKILYAPKGSRENQSQFIQMKHWDELCNHIK